MYGRAVHESDPEKYSSAATPVSWWQHYEKLMDMYLDLDEATAPWQETECLRLLKEHGAERFQGLDSFGIIPEE
jgi:hypothetical protein